MNCSPILNSQQQECPDWYVIPGPIEKAVSAYIRGRALSAICDENRSQRFEINSEKLDKAGIDSRMNNALAGYAAFNNEDVDPALIESLQSHQAFESDDEFPMAA